MENPHKGMVELKIGEKSYLLRYSIDAICTLEGRLDRGVGSIMLEMADPLRVRVSIAREMLYVGLLEYQPEITLKQAGEMIVAGGGVIKVLNKITEAIKASFPEAEAESKERPPVGPRRDGIGRPSSKNGSAKSRRTQMLSGARLPAN